MSGIFTVTKENRIGFMEKRKEFKSNFENSNISEMKEFLELKNTIVQEADIETAKNCSLSSVLEKNKDKREKQNIQFNSINESIEVKEGLVAEQKDKLGELTGWSDKILESIGSWEEAEIYIKAGLKEVEINDKKCLIRDDIDLEQKDKDGITNREKMERGRMPVTKYGEEIELHHIGQKQNSPLAELTMEQHRGVGNDTILHDKTKETEINRDEFGKERRNHWKDRVYYMEGGK